MIFPIGHCLPTKLLTKESYSDLICKLVTEGNVNLIPHLTYDLMSCWDYIGVTKSYGDIQTYKHPHSFMEPNAWMNYKDIKDSDYPNILTKEWLEDYLK